MEKASDSKEIICLHTVCRGLLVILKLDMETSICHLSESGWPKLFQGGRTRLPEFKFSAKFPIGLHVI